ncbi:MAG: histidine phosphatase family protein [Cyanobacteria bacterium P01_F01_bin.42]
MLLIRHAESEGNVARILQGQQEHPLSSRGRHQALALGQFLSTQSWRPTHIYCSPLSRTQETAECCIVDDSPDIKVSPNLIEIHNGILQGLTWATAEQTYPQLCQTLTNSSTWVPIPQAEYPQAVFKRSQTFIEDLLAQHHNRDRIWIFSHGGILQHLIASLMGCDRMWGIPIPPTGLFEFEIDLDHWNTQTDDRFAGHLFQIKRFNQTPHLAES